MENTVSVTKALFKGLRVPNSLSRKCEMGSRTFNI